MKVHGIWLLYFGYWETMLISALMIPSNNLSRWSFVDKVEIDYVKTVFNKGSSSPESSTCGGHRFSLSSTVEETLVMFLAVFLSWHGRTVCLNCLAGHIWIVRIWFFHALLFWLDKGQHPVTFYKRGINNPQDKSNRSTSSVHELCFNTYHD